MALPYRAPSQAVHLRVTRPSSPTTSPSMSSISMPLATTAPPLDPQARPHKHLDRASRPEEIVISDRREQHDAVWGRRA